MPTVDEILLKNLIATHLPSQSLEVTATTWTTGNPASVIRRSTSRVLSRLDRKPDGRITYAAMARVIDGPPINARLLIEQRMWGSPWPLTWVRDPVAGRPRRYGFQPWQPFEGSALRWMDYALPPLGTYTAQLQPGNPPASDPAWTPAAPCWVVDLQLDTSFWRPEPRLSRLWIAQDPAPNFDLRVEQHLSDGMVRALMRVGSTQTVEDPVLGVSTSLVPTHIDPTPIPEWMFSPDVMADQNW